MPASKSNTAATPNITENEMDLYRKAMENATAPAWRPEPETTVVGTVIGMTMRESGYGLYPCITYRLDDGEVINVHAFHTLIRNQLAELKTDIGVRQFITYKGKKTKNNASQEDKELGRDKYHMYFVMNEGDLKNNPLEGKSENFAF